VTGEDDLNTAERIERPHPNERKEKWGNAAVKKQWHRIGYGATI